MLIPEGNDLTNIIELGTFCNKSNNTTKISALNLPNPVLSSLYILTCLLVKHVPHFKKETEVQGV